VVLLVGSTLFVSSFLRLTRVDVGLDTHNLVTFDVNLTGDARGTRSGRCSSTSGCSSGCRRCRASARPAPAATLPIGGDDFGTGFLPEGIHSSTKRRCRAPATRS
jgi:hypothetical protein